MSERAIDMAAAMRFAKPGFALSWVCQNDRIGANAIHPSRSLVAAMAPKSTHTATSRSDSASLVNARR